MIHSGSNLRAGATAAHLIVLDNSNNDSESGLQGDNQAPSQQVESPTTPHGYYRLHDSSSPFLQVNRSPPTDMDPRSLLAANNNNETYASPDLSAARQAMANNDTYVPPAYLPPAVDTARAEEPTAPTPL